MAYFFKPMNHEDSNTIAKWHYEGKYSFYDMQSDPEDLKEFLDPNSWENTYFTVYKNHEIIGFFSFNRVEEDTVDIGLGLSPDLAGRGLGLEFMLEGMRFAKEMYRPGYLSLSVVTFNKRAIKVYERAGFEGIHTFSQETNGGIFEFLKMSTKIRVKGSIGVNQMEHVLVVGGTGMLKDVSIHLNKHGNHTSVIGRTDQKLASLKDTLIYQDNFTPLALDYRDDESIKSSLNEIQSKYGPIKKVISWISTTSPNALQLFIEEVGKWNQDTPWSLFHVLGSRSDLKEVKAKVAPPHNCEYRQIKLGFIIEDRSSRWLTNEEISKGVINGIERNDLITIVGTLTPWEKRP